MALAVVLRLVEVGRSYDLVQDEVDYVVLGSSVRNGHFPPVFPGSGPFLLHPPLFFILSAGWQILLRPSGNWFHLLVDIRILNVIFAAVTAGCLYVLGSRLGSRVTGIAAALLFILDPYVLRQNGRALLETCTTMFVLLGYVLLLRLVQHRTANPMAVAVGGGLLIGLSILCKDMAVVLVAVPLLFLVVLGWGVPRRISATALVASLVPYGIYVIILAAIGSFAAFWDQETAGLRRALGQQKSTGFSKAGSPSLVHTLVTDVTSFGTTYAVLALSLVATLCLLFTSRRPDHRLMTVVTACGAVTIFYELFFGTIEEQFLYFLIVPAMLTLAVGTTVVIERHRSQERANRWARVALAVLVVLSCYNLAVWVNTRTSADNGEQRITEWFRQHAQHPGMIGNDTEVTVYALELTGFKAVPMSGTPSVAAAEHVRYLTVLPVETAGNYGTLTKSEERFYERHGKRVFSFRENTYGDVQIYKTTDPRLW